MLNVIGNRGGQAWCVGSTNPIWTRSSIRAVRFLGFALQPEVAGLFEYSLASREGRRKSLGARSFLGSAAGSQRVSRWPSQFSKRVAV